MWTIGRPEAWAFWGNDRPEKLTLGSPYSTTISSEKRSCFFLSGACAREQMGCSLWNDWERPKNLPENAEKELLKVPESPCSSLRRPLSPVKGYGSWDRAFAFWGCFSSGVDSVLVSIDFFSYYVSYFSASLFG